MLTRRETLQLAAAAVLVPAVARSARADEGKFTLPKLPYKYDALEPHIDAVTMETHHGKHHQAYVDKLNDAFKEHPAWYKKTPEEICRQLKTVPEAIRTAVQNNGGGHWNHSFFWSIMNAAGTGGKPTTDLAQAIDTAFGSMDKFKAAFKAAGVNRFGSGWAWLVVKDKKLAIVSTANQDNPLMDGGGQPVLGVDVWEHAYYLKYKNLRAAYIDAWWNVVDWKTVNDNFTTAMKA